MTRDSYSLLTLMAAALIGAGCQTTKQASAASSLPAPKVAVITAADQDVPLLSEYAAQTYARDLVEVRGRVDGFIEKRLFQIGADVLAG